MLYDVLTALFISMSLAGVTWPVNHVQRNPTAQSEWSIEQFTVLRVHPLTDSLTNESIGGGTFPFVPVRTNPADTLLISGDYILIYQLNCGPLLSRWTKWFRYILASEF